MRTAAGPAGIGHLLAIRVAALTGSIAVALLFPGPSHSEDGAPLSMSSPTCSETEWPSSANTLACPMPRDAASPAAAPQPIPWCEKPSGSVRRSPVSAAVC
jgi:hypothetical protein